MQACSGGRAALRPTAGLPAAAAARPPPSPAARHALPTKFPLPTSAQLETRRPLMELLFARLPPALRGAAIRRVAQFLLESTLTSVGAEAAVLCNAVAWADPQVSRRLRRRLFPSPPAPAPRAQPAAGAAGERAAARPALLAHTRRVPC